MTKLTEDMKNMISTQQCFIATVSKENLPNISPEYLPKVINDNTIIFAELTEGTTYRNLINGSEVSVSVVSRETTNSYRFTGRVEVKESGYLYEEAAAMCRISGVRKPKAVVILIVEMVYNIKPGLCNIK